jgi:alanyl-tRNA synthetase
MFIGATVYEDKPSITLFLSQPMVDSGFDASKMIREAAREINGGGGGQAYLATAGGKNPNGISAAIEKLVKML